MLEEHCKTILKLRSDASRKRWSALTHYRAPHKPFLLLSVLDLFAQGIITSTFIEPSQELVDTFNGYWAAIMPSGSSTSMAYPFPRIQGDGIWKLVPVTGGNGTIDIQSISSMAKLRRVCQGAVVNDSFYKIASEPDSREFLRAALITHFFAEEIRSVLFECGVVNVKSWEYGRHLLKVSESVQPYNIDSPIERKVRDRAFRKIIVDLYDHRCALCGVRMLTPEGHTAVEAAHVIPWSKSRNDHPTNGMALCRLCHWAFDKGLMGVGKDYEVMVSNRVRIDRNLPGHILSLLDRPIVRPGDLNYWPKQSNLEYHRKKIFE